MAFFKHRNFRVSIRSRFFILLLVLTILPFLAYRFAINLHDILIKNQATIQYQTAINLSLILENRTDLWALQILSGTPTTQLAHLNLENSVLWIVNEHGQTTYVVGQLNANNSVAKTDPFNWLGKNMIDTFAILFPFSLPYSFPQSEQPEKTMFFQSIQGKTFQQYRLNSERQPISLMSSSPLRVNGKTVGIIVVEQKMNTLLGDSLISFYRLIAMGALIFLFVVLSAIFHIGALSNRIVRLDSDVRKTLNVKGKISLDNFPDTFQTTYHDELSELRHHIYEMLQQLSSYERYLKQFPKALRHELHNPLNRLSMSLSLLGNELQHKQLDYAQHALEQLKQIIASLTEATSIEDSLLLQTPEKFPIGEMLNHYLENVVSLNAETSFKVNQKIPSSTQIMGDGFMIEQLMDKLLSNAKDFTDGRYPIEVVSEADNHQVIIKVINSGPLLPEGFEMRIFDGMTSIRPVNQDEQAHLGLGLYIVKLIAEYHNGSITAHNRTDLNSLEGEAVQGVEFVLTIPVYPQK